MKDIVDHKVPETEELQMHLLEEHDGDFRRLPMFFEGKVAFVTVSIIAPGEYEYEVGSPTPFHELSRLDQEIVIWHLS